MAGLAATASGATPAQGPGQAYGLVSELGDVNVVALYHSADGVVSTVRESVLEGLVDVGVHDWSGSRLVTTGTACSGVGNQDSTAG